MLDFQGVDFPELPDNPSLSIICAFAQRRCRYPFFVVATMVLFVFSDLGLGTVVNVVFRAGNEVTTIGPAFSFSVLTLSRDSIKGGGTWWDGGIRERERATIRVAQSI